MRWQLKCFVDSCKGVIPFKDGLREIKYLLVPYVPDPSNNDWTIQQGLMQIEALRAVRPLENAVVMEVGSGWQPLIPALYSLAGAGRVYLTDLRRLCQTASFETALASLRLYRDRILKSLGIGEKAFDDAVAWKPSDGLAEGFKRLRLEYLAPCDCRHLDLAAGSLDVVTSRAVLEHIPPDVIQGIFTESFRLLKPGGLACHIVDNSDHWQHSDNSISRVNFLKFPDSVFRWTYLNGLNYQNRLRHSEYLEMLTKSGFTMLREERDVDQPSVAALQTLPLADRFRRFTVEDLATMNSFLLARK
jgi:SAM-dependent methyltransferase